MAVAYAKDRQQFGRPIGAYQAVSHRCAQMLLETENSRSAVYGAAWAADAEPESLPLAASMAKAYASDAGWRVPDASIQVHGGIGFTWEHDLHFFLKRGRANAAIFGDAKWHRERVADAVLAAAEPGARLTGTMGALDRISVAAIGTSVADLEAETLRAEAAGVECVWAPELFRSAVTQAAYLAGEDRAGSTSPPGSSGPSPAAPSSTPISALDIDEMSGGRFRLGHGRRRQTAQRDLAQRRLRQAGAAPARGDRGDAADHAPGQRRRADPLRGRVLRHRHQGLGAARTRRRARRCRSTPPPCRPGWRGWPATSPTG